MTVRRTAAAAALLLAASAAGTAATLLAAPGASPDLTFPLLVLAAAPLAGLVALEHRHPTLSPRIVLGVAGALLVLAVVQPPHGSHDIWSYAMYGRIVAVHHASPYVHAPAEFASDPALSRVAPVWRHAPSVYGPGFTLASAGIMAAAGRSSLLARVGFQGLAAAAVFGVGLLLLRRRVPASVLAAVLLNPLMVVSVASGGHNDALVGLCLLAAALALRRRPAVAGLLFGAAVLVKAVAFLPAVACVVWVWRRQGRRRALTVAAASGAPVLAGYAAFGGVAAIAPVLESASRQSRVSVWRLLPHLSLLARHGGLIAVAAVLGLTVMLVSARISQESAAPVLVASLVGYLLLAGYILPWYFAWVLPVAALDCESALFRVLGAQTAAILLAYQYHATPQGDELDRLLHAGVAAAQVLAVAASILLIGLAFAARPPRPVPAATGAAG